MTATSTPYDVQTYLLDRANIHDIVVRTVGDEIPGVIEALAKASYRRIFSIRVQLRRR